MELPTVHVFVCANRRDPSSPLGEGCGDRGERVYGALKQRVAERGAHRTVWITKTYCLGVCPMRGCTLAIYPDRAMVSEVTEQDALAMLEERCK